MIRGLAVRCRKWLKRSPVKAQSSTTTSGASGASGGSSWARRKPRK